MKIGAAVKIVDLARARAGREAVSGGQRRGDRGRHAADPQSGDRRRQRQPAAALLVLPQRGVRLLQEGRLALLRGQRREPVSRHLRQRRPEPHRPSVEPGGAVRRLRREVPRARPERRARNRRGRLLHAADHAERAEGERARRRGPPDARDPAGAGQREDGHYEVRYKQSHDWPLAFTTVVLTMNGNTIASARVVLGAVAPIPWRSKAAEARAGRQAAQRADRRGGRRSRGRRSEADERQRLQGADREDRGEARDHARGRIKTVNVQVIGHRYPMP